MSLDAEILGNSGGFASGLKWTWRCSARSSPVAADSNKIGFDAPHRILERSSGGFPYQLLPIEDDWCPPPAAAFCSSPDISTAYRIQWRSFLGTLVHLLAWVNPDFWILLDNSDLWLVLEQHMIFYSLLLALGMSSLISFDRILLTLTSAWAAN